MDGGADAKLSPRAMCGTRVNFYPRPRPSPRRSPPAIRAGVQEDHGSEWPGKMCRKKPIDLPLRAIVEGAIDIFVPEVYGTRRKQLMRLIISEGPRFPALAEIYYWEVLGQCRRDQPYDWVRRQPAGVPEQAPFSSRAFEL